ncbi:MAG: phosphoglucosamine mutase [Pirellulaceae bacterium]|nr:phosphoglucosamine mutase [Pirellulaceae bacterium]
MSEPIISVSGLRGTIPDQLTPLVATRYIAALASALPPGKVVISRDGRSSGRMLAAAVSATLAAHGFDVIDLDAASTPTVGIQVRQQKAVAGVQISASHNPKEYNGLKLFGSDGRILTKSAGEKVLAGYRANETKWVGVDAIGKIERLDDPHSAHMDLVLKTIDPAQVRNRKFKVLLDSCHGAGSPLGRKLLEALGCELTLLGGTPDGQFEHKPEPLAENLQSVCELVRTGGFDVGFCQDPDADRLAIIDETGRYIGEEMTLALCLLQALPSRSGTIVTNCASSSISQYIASHHNSTLLRSAVGEANVADLMIAENAVFGGEGSGGPIDPQVGYVRDSFVGMARILQLLTTSKRSISQIVASLPPLAMVKDKATLDSSQLPKLLDALTTRMQDATASRLDGLRLDWADRWLLVRGSNTEPIVRFIAEAPSVAEAQSLCDQARAVSESL